MRSLAALAAVALAVVAEGELVEDKPVSAYGKNHPDCLEWTDGCVVCRSAADDPACSVTGPACVPKTQSCRERK